MTFILNFHGIGDAQRQYEDGEAPYWIDEKRFRDCLDMAQASPQKVVLTFDDSNASDYEIAYPELQRRGLSAIFFVLAGKLGRTGYLTAGHVREIDANPSMRIGTHGMDHQPWPDLDDAALTHEIKGSIDALGAICGRDITSAGLPFGRYDKRVLRELKKHGVQEIYSSDGRAKLLDTPPIPRFSVRSDTDMDTLNDMLSRAPTIITRTMNEARVTVKSLL